MDHDTIHNSMQNQIKYNSVRQDNKYPKHGLYTVNYCVAAHNLLWNFFLLQSLSDMCSGIRFLFLADKSGTLCGFLLL